VPFFRRKKNSQHVEPDPETNSYLLVPVLIGEVEEPTLEALSELAGKRLEMAVSSRELAGLYAAKGWQLMGAAAADKVPNARELLSVMLNLQDLLEEPGDYVSMGRLMAVNDPDFPGETDFYLYVGSMDNMPTDDDDDYAKEIPLV
jgi:hypothetical protein